MEHQYNEEEIVFTIEAVENLGINGFHWGEKDNQFLKSQEELKKSLDTIKICLEWLDEYLHYFTYFSNYWCYASEVKNMIQEPGKLNIPLGCVITALIHNHSKIEYEQEEGKNDLTFRLPSTWRDELWYKKRRIYEW